MNLLSVTYQWKFPGPRCSGAKQGKKTRLVSCKPYPWANSLLSILCKRYYSHLSLYQGKQWFRREISTVIGRNLTPGAFQTMSFISSSFFLFAQGFSAQTPPTHNLDAVWAFLALFISLSMHQLLGLMTCCCGTWKVALIESLLCKHGDFNLLT